MYPSFPREGISITDLSLLRTGKVAAAYGQRIASDGRLGSALAGVPRWHPCERRLATVAAGCMTDRLSRHGAKVNWLLWRLPLPGWVHRHRTMTREMEGRTGPFPAPFVVPINFALRFAVAALIARAATGR